MVLSPGYIKSLPGDPECIAALAYLAEQAERYPPGKFTPPLRRRKRDTEPRPIIAVTMRLGREHRGRLKSRINRVEWCQDGNVSEVEGDDARLVDRLANSLLCRANTGTYLVTSGKDRHVLDVYLEQLGPLLLRLGYTLQPCLSGGAVSFITIRKGRSRWDLVYFETCTGRSVQDGILLAPAATWRALQRPARSLQLWHAAGAYAQWLLSTFGVALQLTVGMAAVSAARVTLPNDLTKWRPAPLLVAMCRNGGGYRGGITYAVRYRGPTWRIDVNRQYTAALASPLPLRSSFGYIPYRASPHPWMAVCRVRLSGAVPYPLGVWNGSDNGFGVRAVANGSYVCVLSSAELPGLLALGATVEPSYGYIHNATFSLTDYVGLLQMVLSTHGRDSAQARFCKPLGNYVYGKTGQLARRTELRFSEDNPGKEWFPYWDDDGVAWPSIWERTVERHTGSQHVDIAAAITATARSQTVSTWALLSSRGVGVVRCHTDSLTTDADPTVYVTLSNDDIGSWRMEQAAEDSIIVGPNAYFSDGEAHIAGVSEPTYDMVERLADGHTVAITQTMKMPRRGFERGDVESERKFRATGR